MISLLFGAAVLGVIISVMEGEFPGWWKTVLCVLAASVPAFMVNYALPPLMFPIGLVVGAACGGVAISAICGMTVKRALIAVSIYFGIQITISFVMYLAFSPGK